MYQNTATTQEVGFSLSLFPLRVASKEEEQIDAFTAWLNKELKMLHNCPTRPELKTSQDLKQFLHKETDDVLEEMARDKAHSAAKEVGDLAKRAAYTYCVILPRDPMLPLKKQEYTDNQISLF